MTFHRLALFAGISAVAFILAAGATLRPAMAQQINLTGDWQSTYACAADGVEYPLRLRVVHYGQSIVAIKRKGDRCITQDNLTVFQGDLQGYSSRMECATYGGNPPAVSYVTDAIQIQDANNFVACQARFRRVGAAPVQQPTFQQQPVNPVTGPASCNSNQWFSGVYQRCFEKRGQCSQYNHTDSKTCNSRSDRLRCDWDVNNNTCYAE